jgi:AraC family transcriptional regulator
MESRIETITERKLIGKRMKMTLSNNQTFQLWQSFMPRRNEIKNNISSELYSVQVNDPLLNFKDFTMDTSFDKWAAVEVSGFDDVPEGMETFTLTGGLYAVFVYKGSSSEGPKVFQYIFGTWLPASDYVLDNRPHFEILGAKYKNNDPDSEEEIWIPVKLKK